MSFSSGTTNQTTSGTSSYTPDATLLSDLYGNYAHAQSFADQPFQPYSGQMVAGFTPDQTAEQSSLMGLAQNQTGAAPLNSAVSTAQGAAGYTPQLLSNTNLSPYMNPYSSSVINSTLADMARQQQIQTQANNTQATQAGAFGGSRSAVLQNLDDDSYDRAVASTTANLNQANYAQAQSAAQADQNLALQGQGLNLNAANALAGMGGQQLSQSLQWAGAQGAAGGAQQQNQQAQLDAAYQQWLLGQQYPIQMQGVLNQTIGTIPNYGVQTSSGSASQSTSNAGLNYASLFSPISPAGPVNLFGIQL